MTYLNCDLALDLFVPCCYLGAAVFFSEKYLTVRVITVNSKNLYAQSLNSTTQPGWCAGEARGA